MDDLSSRFVRRYRVDKRLGAGAMGEVYRAFDSRLKRTVALKRLPAALANDQTYQRRFLNGARHAARLNHPCVAAIYDFFEEQGELFLVMEYVEGRTLDSLDLPLSVFEFLKIAVQCADGLAAAHDEGIVHQDLKPRNIMLDANEHIKILDFGIARRLPGRDAEATMMETGIESTGGTPAFMAPEILMGQKGDQRADLFSLGLVFYELLSGTHPFTANTTTACIDAILHREPIPLKDLNPKLGEELDGLVRKLLEKDSSRRPENAAALLADLRRIREPSANDVKPRFEPAQWRGGRVSGPGPRKERIKVVFLAVVWAFGWLAITLLLLAAVWFGIGPETFTTRPAALPEGPFTVAVLPFSSADSSPAKKAFAAGLHASISERLADLTEVSRFHVTPPALVASKRDLSSKEVGIDAGADVALTALVEYSGTQTVVRLSVEEAGSGQLVGSAEFSGPYSEPKLLEMELTEQILRLLDWQPTNRQRADLIRFGTRIEAAYHFYLQGLGWLTEDLDSHGVESALEAFQASLSLDDRFAAASVGMGRALLKRNSLQPESDLLGKALQSCRKAVELAPDLGDAQLCLGEIALAEGRFEDAVESFKAALYKSPGCYNSLSRLADALISAGKRVEAIQLYQRATEQRPGFWHPHYRRGILLFQNASFEEAGTEFEAVTQAAPQYYRAWTNLSAIYGQLARYDQVRRAAGRSVAIKPTEMAYSNLATAYFYEGLFRESVETYRQSLLFMGEKKDMRYFTILGNLAEALYWSPEEKNQASEFFRQALESARRELDEDLSPMKEATTLGRMALYQAMLGEKDSAKQTLRDALSAAPSDAETLFKAAIIHMHLGESETALTWLGEALAAGIPLNRVRQHPVFEALRQDPRFGALVSPAAEGARPEKG